MTRLTPKTVNKTLSKIGVEIFRASEGYYYFVPISDAREMWWVQQIEPIWAYNLEGFEIERIVEHVESYRNA